MRVRPPTRPGRHSPHGRRALPAALLAGVLALLVMGGAAPGAGAQGQPQLGVEGVHPLGGGSFHFIVDLVDGNGDPLTASTVTATPTNPDGEVGDAVILPSAGDGTYQGPVPLPDDGTWTVRIASSDPAVAIDYGFEVDGETGTPAAGPPTAATPTTAATTDTTGSATTAVNSTTAAVSTTAPASTAVPPEQASTTDPKDDDSSFPTALVVVGAALLVTLAGVPLALRTIRQSTEGAEGRERQDGQLSSSDPGAPTATGGTTKDGEDRES